MTDEDYEIMRHYHQGYKDTLGNVIKINTMPILYGTAYNLGVKHAQNPTTEYLDSKIICEKIRQQIKENDG